MHLPVLSFGNLKNFRSLLSRASHALIWLIVFYICQQLLFPPIVIYSDDILYDWASMDP